MGESRRPENGVCQRFTGLRQWGIGPAEPWRICQNCGWPKAQHELPSCPGVLMILLGIVLLVIGYFLGFGILELLGIILIVLGAVFWIAGGVGHPVGGRRYWY